jgi:hypothetical protein
MRIPGVRIVSKSDAIVTAAVPIELAIALREEARANCRTISGQIRFMLAQQFAKPDAPTEATQ